MPNHVHGIIWITTNEKASGELHSKEQFGHPVSRSLATVIRSYKSAVTLHVPKRIVDQYGVFWQRNYYEHIIKNDEELERIRQYIIANPFSWEQDQINPKNL